MNQIFSVMRFAALMVCASAVSAQAQFVVYKLEMNRVKGINYHPFEGGYVLAPVLGGSASFILTTTENGRTYSVANEGGRFFTAINLNSRKAVLSAMTGEGASAGSMVAFGDIDFAMDFTGPNYQIRARVARSLNGSAVSADDESTLAEIPLDGSIGSAGISEIKLSLDERESRKIDQDNLSQEQALTYLQTLLERMGYVDQNAQPVEDPDVPGQDPAVPGENPVPQPDPVIQQPTRADPEP